MANKLIVGADVIVTIDKLMQPNSNPPVYINSGTLTWQLIQGFPPPLPPSSPVVLGTGTYGYISGSNGEWQTVVPQSLTVTLTSGQQFTLKSNVTATGFVSLFQDEYITVNPESLQFAYCVRSDLENIYGVTNIKKWADIDNSGVSTTIDARINWAITLAYDYINNQLVGGVYATPLTGGGDYPMIVAVAAHLASVYLYESRELQNYTEEGQPLHQLTMGKKWAENILLKLRAGTLRIQKALPQDVLGINYPTTLRATRCLPYYGWSYFGVSSGLYTGGY